MKSSSTHLTLIIIISAMSSLNLCAQKRFDNPEQKRKVLITREGPRTAITEAWVPADSLDSHQNLMAAIYHKSESSSLKKSDSTRVSMIDRRLGKHGDDIDQPKRRGRSKSHHKYVVLRGH